MVVRKNLKAEEKYLDLDAVEREILKILSDGNEYTFNELVERTGYSKNTVRDRMYKLEEKRLVKRRWFGMWLWKIDRGGLYGQG